jgi:hypothetical protein
MWNLKTKLEVVTLSLRRGKYNFLKTIPTSLRHFLFFLPVKLFSIWNRELGIEEGNMVGIVPL